MIDFTQIEDLGNAVKINDTIIPAVNIQVDGFPCVIDGHNYDIFFEILFEFGISWSVEIEEDGIKVTSWKVLFCNGEPCYELLPSYCSFNTNSLEAFVAAYVAEVSWRTMAYAETMTERFEAA